MSGPDAGVLWLFDLGNTSCKGRCVQAGHAPRSLLLEWNAPDFERELAAHLSAWPAPARVLAASVTSAGRAARVAACLRRWPDLQPEWISSPRQGCGITSAYRVPARLGVDRFLAMAGARAASSGAPCVIVGCGTALTLDAVDAEGRHRGGLIAPSPDLMMRSLQAGTAIGDRNPEAFPGRDPDPGDDTAAAIRAGCWRAAVALVESFHADQRAHPGASRLWLHGGGAAALKAHLDSAGGVAAELLEDAVWRGLELWAASRPVAGTTA